MESLSERYHRETGLHSHYCAFQPNSGKRNLVFTRKYVWWLEKMIKDAQNCLVCLAIANPLEVAENTYQILTGEEQILETSTSKKKTIQEEGK